MAKRLYTRAQHTCTRGGRNLLWAYENNNHNIPSGYLFIIIIIISPRFVRTRRVCIALVRTRRRVGTHKMYSNIIWDAGI